MTIGDGDPLGTDREGGFSDKGEISLYIYDPKKIHSSEVRCF